MYQGRTHTHAVGGNGGKISSNHDTLFCPPQENESGNIFVGKEPARSVLPYSSGNELVTRFRAVLLSLAVG